jgi:outer membrane protein TolC
VTVSEQLLAQANQALDLAETRYKLGLSSIVELSQAQLQQTQGEIGNAQAGYAYRLALSVLALSNHWSLTLDKGRPDEVLLVRSLTFHRVRVRSRNA